MLYFLLTVRKIVAGLIIVFTFYSFSLKSQNNNWTLKSCVDTALHNNTSIQQYANTSEIYRITLEQSKANLLPSLNGSANQSLSFGRSLNPVSYQYTTGVARSNSFSINGSLPIFTGFQNYNTIKQNQLNYESSKQDIESIKNDIIINVINAYLQLLFAKELVKNYDNEMELASAQLDKTKQLLEVGKKSESDVLQLKADFAEKKRLLINSQGQLKIAKLNLQQLMNIDVQQSFDIEYSEVIEPELPNLSGTKEIFTSALITQPSIKSSQLKTQSAMYSIKILQGNRLPRLSLIANIATNYSNASKDLQVDYINTVESIGYLQSNSNEVVLGTVSNPIYTYNNYSFANQLNDNLSKALSLSLSIPIFNSQTRYEIQKQKINLNNAKLNEQIAKNTLQKSIEQAYADVENSIAKYNATKEQVDALQESLQNTSIKYDNQLISATDLLVEKNKYTQALSDYIQSKYELIFNIKILDYYKGTLNF